MGKRRKQSSQSRFHKKAMRERENLEEQRIAEEIKPVKVIKLTPEEVAAMIEQARQKKLHRPL